MNYTGIACAREFLRTPLLLVTVAASLFTASLFTSVAQAQPWPATSCAGDRNLPAIKNPLNLMHMVKSEFSATLW